MAKRLDGKSLELWAVESPHGTILDFTIKATRKACIDALEHPGWNETKTFEDYKREGFTVVKGRFVKTAQS